MVTILGFYFNSENRKVTVCEQVPISEVTQVINKIRKFGGNAEII
jgi:hypothetical protein